MTSRACRLFFAGRVLAAALACAAAAAESSRPSGATEAGGASDWILGRRYLYGEKDKGREERAGQDLEKAEPLLRRAARAGSKPALDDLACLAQAYMYRWWGAKRDLARAEELLRIGLDARHAPAAESAARLAAAYVERSWGTPRDLAHAESLARVVTEKFPDHPRALLVMASIRDRQGRYDEAYELAGRAFVNVIDDAKLERNARIWRVRAAMHGGRMDAAAMEDLRSIVSDYFGKDGGLVLAVFVAVLGGLVCCAWLVRDRGPGLVLAGAWLAAAAVGAGMGLMVRLPGWPGSMPPLWLGTGLIGASCAAAIAVLGPARYFGAIRRPFEWRAFLRGAGLVAGLIVAAHAVDVFYGWLYERIAGHAPEDQFVGWLLSDGGAATRLGNFAVAAAVVPFYEEVICRGFLFDAVRRRWGAGWALGVSALAFALAHELTYAPALFIFGLAAGWLKLQSGNLRLCFLFHATNNALFCAVLFFFPDA